MMDKIEKMMAKSRETVTLGDVPPALCDLVADAIDIVAPNLGPRVPAEIGGMLVGIIALHLVGDIRALDEIIP